MSGRCRWFTDKEIGRYFVPGCMGAAVYGEHRCTCPKRDTAPDRLSRLEQKCEDLTALVERLVRAHPDREGKGGER